MAHSEETEANSTDTLEENESLAADEEREEGESGFETMNDDCNHNKPEHKLEKTENYREPTVGTVMMTGENNELPDTLVSPTEEALEDLISIIPQLHNSTDDLRYGCIPSWR